jgi:hypothetical protein
MCPVRCYKRERFRRPVFLDPASTQGDLPPPSKSTLPRPRTPFPPGQFLTHPGGLCSLARPKPLLMPAELGGSQISSLLEALPGIASVLRSPVADALIKAMRGAVGLADFTSEDAEELVRYAVRRGLIGPDEGDRVLSEVQEGLRKRKPIPVKKAAAKKGKKARR